MNRKPHSTHLTLLLSALLLPFALGACADADADPVVDEAPAAVVETNDGAADAAANPATNADSDAATNADAENAAAEADAEADAAEADAAADESDSESNTTPAETTAKPVLINLNTASRDDFLTVPNSGERMAREFDEYRPYATIGQFRREIGKYVDEAQVAEYLQYLFVPIDPATADADTFMQIPGLDQAAADAIAAGVPYANADALLAALAQQAPDVDTAVAAGYLAAP